MKSIALIAPLALLFSACATAKAPTAEQAAPLKIIKTDASIPFASIRSSIDDWTMRTDGSLLIKSGNKKFYHVTFFNTCVGLDFAQRVAFHPNPTGELDKYSSISFDRQTCHFGTFDEVADPRAAAAPPPT